MNLNIVKISVLGWTLALAGCHSGHQHDHDGHQHSHSTHGEHHHEDHDEDHDEDHVGHDHAAEKEHDHEEHDHDHEAAKGEAHAIDEISFSEAQAKAAGLELEIVKKSAFAQVEEAAGQILVAGGDEHVMVAPMSGVVAYAKKTVANGMPVGNKETLFTISGQSMVEGDAVAKAQSEYEAAKAEYERTADLVKDKIVTQSVFENAKLRYENAKASYAGVAKLKSGSGASVSAPIAGFVKNCMVQPGEYVQAGQPMAVVSKNKRLQLRADMCEHTFGLLPSLKSANFVMPYRPGMVFKLNDMNGKLISTGKAVSENSFMVPVIFEFDNVGDVVPGAFVQVFLQGAERQGVISVPVGALTEEQGLFYVYIQVDEDGYMKREVKLGQSDGDRTEILSGLQEGEKVVVKGATQVRLAAASGRIPEGHSHSH